MAETFLFEVDTPLESEDAVTTVRCYESADGATGWAVVDSVALATLTPDGDGVYTWPSALADSAQHHQLVPVSVVGIERPGAEVLPPRGGDPSVFTLYCYTKDLGLGILAGVRMQAVPADGATYKATGSNMLIEPASKVSDSNGYVALVLPAGVGNVDVSLDRHRVTVDTTGRGGTAVNLVTLL